MEFAFSACKDNLRGGMSGAMVRDELGELLQSLEHEMRVQGRWDERPPPPEALTSTEPFAVDTLSFDQWLQWILLPRLDDLLRRQLPLPTDCAIRPMAEETYGPDDVHARRLIVIIGDIDALLTGSGSGPN